MIYIVSFGSDIKYESLSYDVIKSFFVAYPASASKLYTPCHLPQWINDYARLYQRGYGYWVWKPWILNDMMKYLKNSDILLYVDGRSGIPKPGETIQWLDTFLKSVHFDIAAWQMGFIEQHWCTSDLASALGASNNQEILATGQFAATFFALRMGEPTRSLMKTWLKVMQDLPSLCRDEPTLRPNHQEFIENRHDQSVFSILLKTMIADKTIAPLVLSDNDIESDNLLAHVKRHPGVS